MSLNWYVNANPCAIMRSILSLGRKLTQAEPEVLVRQDISVLGLGSLSSLCRPQSLYCELRIATVYFKII